MNVEFLEDWRAFRLETAHSVYLMQQVRCPAVLIECGFLSNPAETQALKSASYQTELAVVIAAGVLNTTNGAAEHEES